MNLERARLFSGLNEEADSVVEARRGPPSVGMVFDEGVVVATAEVTESRLRESFPNNFHRISETQALVSSGSDAQAMQMADWFREEHAGAAEFAKRSLDAEELLQSAVRLSRFPNERREQSVLIVGDGANKQLSETLPNGNIARFRAVATGNNCQEIGSYLEEQYTEGLREKEAVELLIDSMESVEVDETRVTGYVLHSNHYEEL